jgi:GH18 family chitinase
MVQVQNWLGNLLSYGIPGSKISLGVPFSGYHASIISVDPTPNFITYRSIVAQANPTPSVNMFMNYGFNGVDLVGKKVAYLRQYGFGGVLASDISHDTTVASAYSLTGTLAGAKK